MDRRERKMKVGDSVIYRSLQRELWQAEITSIRTTGNVDVLVKVGTTSTMELHGIHICLDASDRGCVLLPTTPINGVNL